MKTKLILFAAAAASLTMAAGAQAPRGQASKGQGNATYWMTAETTSGMGAMSGGNRAGMMNALMRGSAQESYTRSLMLQLGTGRRAPGEPNAEHLPPAGLHAGSSLPLVTPRAAPAPASPVTGLQGSDRPRGRMLIYWGCGDTARPGQPAIIDLAAMSQGRVPPAFANANIRMMTPPSAGRHATYGEWPNQRSQAQVPARGSLVGEHAVRGNYTPDIRFTVGQSQDFLAPVSLTSQSPSAAGAVPLAWRPIAGATAWFASTIGAAENGDMIMWSSSETQVPAMMLDYLAPEEVARLTQRRILLPATADRCTVPAEVARAAPQSMLSVTAFGGESNFAPSRPAGAGASWRPDWGVKLRTRSSYRGIMGMDMAAMNGDRDEEASPAQERPRRRSLLQRGIEGLIRR